MDADAPTGEVLDGLFTTIESRKANLPEDSCTTTLFTHEKGGSYVLERPDEETTETILATKDDDGEEPLYESIDLVYHLLAPLSMKDASLNDLRDELKAHF